MPDDDITFSYREGQKAGNRQAKEFYAAKIEDLEAEISDLRLSEPIKVAVQKENIQLKEKIAASEEAATTFKKTIQGLEEQVRNLKSATATAAETTVTALDRLIEMEKVVKAAESWASGGSHAALTDAVTHWQKLKKTWS